MNMAITQWQVSPTDITTNGVQSEANIPVKLPDAMKIVFDRLPSFIVTKYNSLITELNTWWTNLLSKIVVNGDGLSMFANDGTYRKTIPYTGFTNNSAINVSYNSTARTVTLTGTFEAYYHGKVVTELVTSWVSDPHEDANGIYYLRYDGTFIFDVTPPSFSDVLIASIYYDTTSKFGMRECHGTMQDSSHEEAHQTIGCYKSSGGDFTGWTPTSITPAERRPLISETTIKDEDLQTILPALSTEVYTRRYLSGTNTRNFQVDQTDIISVTGSVPNWNQLSGTWVQTPFTNDQYGAIFVASVPVTSDTGSQKFRYIFVQPQRVSTTLSVIQGLTPSSVVLGDSTTLVAEFCFIAKIIIRYVGGGTNNWTITSIEKLEGTKISQIAIQATPPSASAVSVTPTGNISALDVQSALAELDTEKLTVVTAPVATTSTGVAGNVAVSGEYLYLCTATNTWRRIQITGTW
jgi:hypothetical protein